MRASKNINKYFKRELYFSLISLILSFLDNNFLEIVFSLLIMLYNIYSIINRQHNFSMIIDDRKNNLRDANKVSLLYKIKFVCYTIIACLSSINFVLQILGVDEYVNKLKVI